MHRNEKLLLTNSFLTCLSVFLTILTFTAHLSLIIYTHAAVHNGNVGNHAIYSHDSFPKHTSTGFSPFQ